MGYRITQKIYTCDLCNNTPKDGEHLYKMGNEVWCLDCCEKKENEEKNCSACDGRGARSSTLISGFLKCPECGKI